jgi:hypothetical protein
MAMSAQLYYVHYTQFKSLSALTQKESHCVRGLDCALIYSVFNTNI